MKPVFYFLPLSLMLLSFILAQINTLPRHIIFLFFLVALLLGFLQTLLGLGLFIKGFDKGFLPFTTGFIPATILFCIISFGLSTPTINDVTTAYPAPNLQQTINHPNGKKIEYPIQFIEIIKKNYPFIKTLHLSQTKEEVFPKLIQIIKKQSRSQITFSDTTQGTISVTYSSRLFHFKDDLTILVKNIDKGSSIDFRSRSRTGKSDFGVNARRILGLIDDLNSRAEKK